MKILVTGSAGFIGGYVVEELLQAGHRVTIYDNLSHGARQAVPAGARLVIGELGDHEALSRVFSSTKPEAVMHFAALIEAGESMKVPERYFRNNTATTLTLMETMLEHGVNRFVFSSTAALYGDPVRIPIEESDPLCPTNAYGESKLLVERMLQWFYRIHGFRYASLRYFNAAGATPERGEAHEPESHLIPLVLQVALSQRKQIEIYGTDYPTPDGTCIRDYVHVADLAEAHVRALQTLVETGASSAYNLGTGHPYSVRDVIDTVERVTNQQVPWTMAPRRPGDPAVLYAAPHKARAELGWQPRFPDLESIVRTAWAWHRMHPHGYARA